MKSVNCWLFKYPEPTLLDCGENTKESWEALLVGLKTNGLAIKDINKIVITHAHVDHMGMASRVAQESGAKVYLSEYASDWAEHVEVMWNQRTKLIRQTFVELIDTTSPILQFFNSQNSGFNQILNMWEAIPSDRVAKFESRDGIEMGGRQWEVIYAPGHSSSQTVFFDPHSREIMSADMLLAITPTPVIEFDPIESDKRQMGLPKMLESFHKMKALNISIAYPGHYAPFEQVNDVIDTQLTRIETRLEFALTKIKDGIKDFDRLFLELYPKRAHFPALVMMIGYLDVLEDRGLIRKEKDENDKFKFYPI